MKILFSSLFLIGMFFSINSHAQDESKNVNIGSTVLKQDGTDKNSFKNGPYTYEKIYAVDNLKKEEIYDKLKSWIVSHFKVSNDNVVYDDAGKESITFNIVISTSVDKKVLPIQDVSFKVFISIKDNKIRIQAKDFEFYGVDYAKKIYKSAFHDLRPLFRSGQKNVYEDFDKKFSEMITGLTIGAFDAKKNDW